MPADTHAAGAPLIGVSAKTVAVTHTQRRTITDFFVTPSVMVRRSEAGE
jgi:hypothetical protein